MGPPFPQRPLSSTCVQLASLISTMIQSTISPKASQVVGFRMIREPSQLMALGLWRILATALALVLLRISFLSVSLNRRMYFSAFYPVAICTLSRMTSEMVSATVFPSKSAALG